MATVLTSAVVVVNNGVLLLFVRLCTATGEYNDRARILYAQAGERAGVDPCHCLLKLCK